MRRKTVYGIAGGALLVAAALGIAVLQRKPVVDPELRRDLEMALDTSSIELAPSGPRTQVVSAIELNEAEKAPAPSPAPRPSTTTVRRPTRAAPAPVRTPVRVRAEPAREVAEAPAESGTPAEEPVPAPAAEERTIDSHAPSPMPIHLPAQGSTPARRGGGWTTADVIRNAPFPINPLSGGSRR